MELSPEQKERIARFVPAYQQYEESIEYQADMTDQQRRKELYGRLLAPAALDQMGELEFGQVISSLWASRMWSNKGYIVSQLIQENNLPMLRESFKRLLWEDSPIAVRYDAFRRTVKGLGSSSVTEILAYVHPDECAPWNDRARKALEILGFEQDFPAIRKSRITGQKYEIYNDLIGAIRDGTAGRELFSLRSLATPPGERGVHSRRGIVPQRADDLRV
jgi:hypothetical protein